MSSAVELSNDTYLINYAVDDTVKDAATSQFVHVLAKAETPTGPFHWTAYQDAHCYGVSEGCQEDQATTKENAAFVSSMEALSLVTTEGVSTTAKVRTIQAPEMESALTAINGLIQKTFKATPLQRGEATTSAKSASSAQRCLPVHPLDYAPRRCRLLARKRWDTLDDHDRDALVRAQKEEGRLFLTQPMDELLLSKSSSVFHPSYRSVSLAASHLPVDSPMHDKRSEEGHMIFIAPPREDDAAHASSTPQLLAMQMPQNHMLQGELEWMHQPCTDAPTVRCHYDDGTGVVHLSGSR